ncbi:DUF4291 family protein [Peterkaempfera bronchialis]
MDDQPPYRAIRARWDEETITVYQAYHPDLAAHAATQAAADLAGA